MKIYLECKDTLDMNVIPKLGERLWCKHCEVFRHVTAIDAVWIRCTNCTYARRSPIGHGNMIAGLHANRHGHSLTITTMSSDQPQSSVHPSSSMLF